MHVTQSDRANLHRALSARQAQIAALVARGKPNREIACALWLSRRTVDAHLAALFNKLHVSSRSELIAALSMLDAGDAVASAPETSLGRRTTRSDQISQSTRQALSARQAQIAALVACGKSNREIALTLGRSARTIDAHLVAIFRRLNVGSRGELAVAFSRSSSHLAVVPTSQTMPKLPGLTSSAVPSCELAGLSARQAQVAALVAIGRSNREIGADLLLSSRTVATHVIALINKLNVGSRGELIAALNQQNASVEPDCGSARKQIPAATSVRDGSSEHIGDFAEANQRGQSTFATRRALRFGGGSALTGAPSRGV